MIVPSKVYCNNHKCMKTYNNQGQTEYIQDFEKALLDNDLNQAITALNARLVARGFETKNLSSALNTLKTEKAESAVMMSIEGGASVAETPIDVLRRVANADIWIEINWTENTIKGGSEKTLTFSMSAIDSYTDFVVGGIPPTTSHNSFSSSFNIALAIESAIQGQFDPFCNTMVIDLPDGLIAGEPNLPPTVLSASQSSMISLSSSPSYSSMRLPSQSSQQKTRTLIARPLAARVLK